MHCLLGVCCRRSLIYISPNANLASLQKMQYNQYTDKMQLCFWLHLMTITDVFHVAQWLLQMECYLDQRRWKQLCLEHDISEPNQYNCLRDDRQIEWTV